MSTVIANYSNTDVTDITIEQSGSSRAEVFLEEPLLDATKTYFCSVSEMAVPMSEEPMITYNLTRRELLYIRRRRVGSDITSGDILMGDSAQAEIDYRANLIIPEEYKLYTPSDFIGLISQWAAGFSRQIFERGFPANSVDNIVAGAHHLEPARGNEVLHVGMTPSGVLSFRGTSYFWRNFYIETTAYARSLLGVTHTEICLSQNPNGTLTKNPTLMYGGNNIVLASGIATGTVRQTYNLDHSVFRFLEERMYVSLEVGDLSIPMNQLIRDGKETRTNELVSFPLETKYKTTIKIENSQVQSAVDLELDTHISRVHFISKNEPSYSWYPLKSAYMVQNMRLELFIMRRIFDTTKNSWIYYKQPVNIHKEAVWNASLKFVSVH
jgi:hypothetical protein